MMAATAMMDHKFAAFIVQIVRSMVEGGIGMTPAKYEASQAVSRYDSAEMVATIKATVCKGASDAQLKMFLEVCKRTGLDPFLKEIWFVVDKGIIMAARDGYLRVANEHPMFDGMETRIERDDKGIPIKAVCTVWRKDRSHPTICEAYYDEYKKPGPVWQQYKSAMIGKVAEVSDSQAFIFDQRRSLRGGGWGRFRIARRGAGGRGSQDCGDAR